ncbi:MAG: COQ9 family protein [Paracoccaceae bacterium]
MPAKKKTERDHIAEARERILAAAIPNVAFDGWSAKTLARAVRSSGVDAGLATLAFPRGVIDLALAFHADGDRRMVEALRSRDLSRMRFSERIATAIRLRLEAITDREAARRGASLFALPVYAADGAAAIWRTADAIWNCLGDKSQDVGWYTKRMTLAAVYSSCLLYWLGDESPGGIRTREFIARRIDEVMRVERLKERLRENPLGRAFQKGPGRLLDRIRAPGQSRVSDLPGHIGGTG